MDAIGLAQKMKRLVQWLDSQTPGPSTVRKRFDGPPYGNCYVTIDPERQASAASPNMNRVHLCGVEAGMDSGSLQHLTELFTAAGIKRFFVWLSPGPDMDTVRGWLDASGFARVRWTGYPTLYRSSRLPVPFKTDLEIRQVGVDDIDAVRDQLSETMMWPSYQKTAGLEGFSHYMAFEGKHPVATASLCVFEGLGYLMNAATSENDRGRGAQQALIAKRVERAGEAGCELLVSETLTMLEHSLRNLQRAGFQEAYEKEVYEWSA